MKTRHKHAEIIKAWAEGSEIEFLDVLSIEPRWREASRPSWNVDTEYRIKAGPKPDITEFYWVERPYMYMSNQKSHNLKLTFDGETGKLKSSEVI